METEREQFGDNPPAIIERDGFKIIVNDNLPPEANAMTMALYSRDPQSYLVHLIEVLKRGWKKFMAQFYVGYGHQSIGDCGSTNICAEGVSMLGAKAIQDNELYDGQEASTRYMNMKSMRVLNPTGTAEGAHIQERWMSFYSRVLEVLVPYLTAKYPRLEEDKPADYEKAIKAKAFDIARGFLPAGCTTFVGWHTNLRQAADHIYRMRFHPLPEVRAIAETMLEAVRMKYPSSFNHKVYPEKDAYQELCGAQYYRFAKQHQHYLHTFDSKFHFEGLRQDQNLLRLLAERPAHAELPKIFKQFGTFMMRAPIDFGSFRDLQRHRGVSQVMPLLTLNYGFHAWYLNSLPEDLRAEAEAFLDEQEALIKSLEVSEEIRQYYIAMGYRVIAQLNGGLPGIVYLLELRSGQTVHSTLRLTIQEWARNMQKCLPEMALHCDMGPDQWTTKRGKQDIVRKE
jgi:thymidylate synthase ThyX